MLLSEGQIGRNYEVQSMNLPVSLGRRLEALGMTPRTLVSVLNRKGRGILIVKIRGTRFALGENITKKITVRESA